MGQDRYKSQFNKINKIGGNITQILTIPSYFAINKNKKLVYSDKKIVIGTISKDYINDKLILNDSFKRIYSPNRTAMNPKYYNNLLNHINEIIPFGQIITGDAEILSELIHIYDMKLPALMNIIIKDYDIQNACKRAIHHLFIKYKIFLENLIDIYIELRNDYIILTDQSGINKSTNLNNLHELLDKWNNVDSDNKINTSSILLFFTFPPTSYRKKLSDSLNKKNSIKWDIDDTTTYKYIQKFFTDIKTEKYYYPGYCPYVATHRFLLLLKFPCKNIINAINTLIKITKTKKYKVINDKYIKSIEHIYHAIKIYDDLQKKSFNIKDVSHTTIDTSKFTDIPSKIRIFENFIKGFIKLFIDITPYLVSYENQINKLAVHLNKIADNIPDLKNHLK